MSQWTLSLELCTKNYTMYRDQFMSKKTQDQRFIRIKRLLKKFKYPEVSHILQVFFSFRKKKLTFIKILGIVQTLN